MFASPWKDALIVLFIVLLFFGPKRLPALSRSIGESIKEFKGGIAQSTGPDAQSEIAPGTNAEAGSPASAATEQVQTSTTSEHSKA